MATGECRLVVEDPAQRGPVAVAGQGAVAAANETISGPRTSARRNAFCEARERSSERRRAASERRHGESSASGTALGGRMPRPHQRLRELEPFVTLEPERETPSADQ